MSDITVSKGCIVASLARKVLVMLFLALPVTSPFSGNDSNLSVIGRQVVKSSIFFGSSPSEKNI